MNFLRNRSIRTKIIIGIVAVSTINIIIASFIFFHFDKNLYYGETVKKLKILSKVIGDSNTATLTFKSRKDALEYLQSLKYDPNILKASLIFPDSTLFAEYNKKRKYSDIKYQLSIDIDTIFYSQENIVMNTPIIMDESFLGSIQIIYSLEELNKKLNTYYQILGAIILGSILVASVLAFIFQKVIVDPVFVLQRLMSSISKEHNYKLRAKIESNDEIGKLGLGFNKMISQIEKQNTELKESKELAEASLKAKERFLANITHELRTPLNSVIGLTNLLLDDNILNHEQKEYLSTIKISSRHLLSIINDLLEYSKLGEEKLQLDISEFSIKSTLLRIETTMEYELQKRNLYYKIHIDSNIPKSILGDEYRLNQILINLVGNAIKFSPIGGITVEANLIDEIDDLLNIEFRVKDTGIGIKKEKLELIFESFTQETNDTSRRYGGTGLGLSITKQLVELQGGEIQVFSTKGEGSTFVFNIPYHKVGSMKRKSKKVIPMIKEDINILLVDDNQLNLSLTKSILEKSNFKVTTIQESKKVLDALLKGNFGLVLMDLHMPDLDGFEVTKEIRIHTNKTIANIPIIALTAAGTKNEINKCYEVGMDDFLIKPFNREELISKILSLVKINKDNDHD